MVCVCWFHSTRSDLKEKCKRLFVSWMWVPSFTFHVVVVVVGWLALLSFHYFPHKVFNLIKLSCKSINKMKIQEYCVVWWAPLFVCMHVCVFVSECAPPWRHFKLVKEKKNWFSFMCWRTWFGASFHEKIKQMNRDSEHGDAELHFNQIATRQ